MITFRNFVIGLWKNPKTKNLVSNDENLTDVIDLAMASKMNKVPFMDLVQSFNKDCLIYGEYLTAHGSWVMSRIDAVFNMWRQLSR